MKKIHFILLAICILVMPLAVNAEPVPGVTDNEVNIGVTNPFSGPAAIWGATGMGIKAYADYINAQGGVHGRKINVLLKDDGYNPARGLANIQEMKGGIFAVAGLIGSALIQSSRDFIVDNKILLMCPLGNSHMFINFPKEKLKYTFVNQCDFEDEAHSLTKYAMNNLGTKKLAIFYQNDEYGKGAGLQGVKRCLADFPGKVELVGEVPYEVTDRALENHAMKLKESGADTVISYGTPTHTILILKNMSKIGYSPKFVSSGTNADPMMFKLAGPLWEGVYIDSGPNCGNPGLDPDADRVAEILKKYEPKIAGKEYLGLFGSATMILTVEGLKRAGRDLTTESMIKALETVKGWKSEGFGAPITFGPDKRHGANSFHMMQAVGGKYKYISDWIEYPTRF
jgi:branched-chain amino acid transport system substrate-binding protein